jgi:glycosyltransferase involved in cell wall biosynthesis
MDILFVANWSAPGIVGANYASSGVHLELSKRNLDIGVLSWLVGQNLDEANYDALELDGQKLIQLECNTITYILPSLPEGWSARHIHNEDWNDAVLWGVALLKKYRPKIVHIQQWQGFWWMAEAAKKCSIPYNYTPYDFGLICPRTVLIKSDGDICDGRVDDEECKRCVYNGRGLVGRINENLVQIPLFSYILKKVVSKFPELKLHDRGIVLDPISIRLRNDRERLYSLLSGLNYLIVNSGFSSELFSSRFQPRNILCMPWFHNFKGLSKREAKGRDDLITIGFVGRISPEKGLAILLEALVKVDETSNGKVKLIVAGDYSDQYAQSLKKSFNNLNIEWTGWVDAENLPDIYNRLDLLVVPSVSYDNGPITIMEAIATKTPVIVSSNETLLTYTKDIQTEHVFQSGSSDSLAKLLLRYVEDPTMISNYISELPNDVTVDVYVDKLMRSYDLKSGGG